MMHDVRRLTMGKRSMMLASGIALCFLFPMESRACDGCDAHRHGDGSHPHSPAHHGHERHTAGQLLSVRRQSGAAESSRLAPVTFAVVGDTQGGEFGSGILDELTRDINAVDPDFVLFPGDLLANSGLAGWQAWKNTTAALGNRRLMTPGNHDVGPNATFANWQNTFDWLPASQSLNGRQGVDAVDYFVDSNNVRFVSIATDRPGQPFGGGNPAALDWLREVMIDVENQNNDVDPGNDIDHVFTFSHRPVTTQNESGTGGTDGAWWTAMTGQDGNSNTVSAALLPGHWHMYQPSRPDPRVDTMEIISGTGGGGLEGAPFRNRHGFSLITVNGADVTSQFYGDNNGSAGGWNFTNILDSFTVRQQGGLPTGELALYEFEGRGPDQDTSASPLSKAHRLNFNGSAQVENDPARGDVLRLNGGGDYVDAKNIGDNNLAVLTDMTISFYARAENLGGGPSENILVAFGGAHGSLNGSLNNQESANHAYQLSLTDAGNLQLAWQHDDGIWETVVSNGAVSDPTAWHEYEIQRDADSRGVGFFVDGEQLGQVLAFDFLPTGAGSGSLYIGSGVGGSLGFDGWIDDFQLTNDPVILVPVIVGDFNSDGMIDDLDWLIFADGLGTSGASLTDLDGDGSTGHPDFLLFRGIYDDFNGAGSFQSMLASLPEPSSWILLILGVAALRNAWPRASHTNA